VAALYQADDWYISAFLTVRFSLDLIDRMTVTLMFQV
jgi:hypothetical protein